MADMAESEIMFGFLKKHFFRLFLLAEESSFFFDFFFK